MLLLTVDLVSHVHEQAHGQAVVVVSRCGYQHGMIWYSWALLNNLKHREADFDNLAVLTSPSDT